MVDQTEQDHIDYEAHSDLDDQNDQSRSTEQMKNHHDNLHNNNENSWQEHNEATMSPQSNKQEEENAVNVLFITGLSQKTTTDDLIDLFSQYAKVVRCHLVMDPHTKLSRGFGFITFETESIATDIMEKFSGMEIHGRNVSLQRSKRSRPRTPTPGQYRGEIKRKPAFFNQPPYRDPRDRYYERNQPPMEPYGERVRVPIDRYRPPPRRSVSPRRPYDRSYTDKYYRGPPRYIDDDPGIPARYDDRPYYPPHSRRDAYYSSPHAPPPYDRRDRYDKPPYRERDPRDSRDREMRLPRDREPRDIRPPREYPDPRIPPEPLDICPPSRGLSREPRPNDSRVKGERYPPGPEKEFREFRDRERDRPRDYYSHPPRSIDDREPYPPREPREVRSRERSDRVRNEPPLRREYSRSHERYPPNSRYNDFDDRQRPPPSSQYSRPRDRSRPRHHDAPPPTVQNYAPRSPPTF